MNSAEAWVQPAVTRLRAGGVVAVATESSFGLLADAKSGLALDRLFTLKGRDSGKGVALITPSFAAWRGLVKEIPEAARALARQFWPGPLTIALPAAPELDPRLLVDGTVGVRMPGPCAAWLLARAFDGALTATSANLAGEPPLCSADDVARQLGARDPELWVVPGTAPGGPPSTVVKLDGSGWTIARAGAIDENALASALVIPTSDESS